MPEGDVVWRTARRLHEALAGRALTASDFRVPALATVDLAGRRVRDVVSRGKHLLARVEPDLTLHTHLRMDGEWHLYRPGARWRGGPGWQVRVVLTNAGWQAVGYRLPVVELLPTGKEDRVVGHLGPDLLGPDWDTDEAVRLLAADPDREIGDALLDQRNLAGIGNLYKAEVLFLRGVSPWRRVGDVADLRALVELARRLMEANKDRTGQVTTGLARPGASTWVYGRAGRACRRCGTPVRRAEPAVGGGPPDRGVGASRAPGWRPPSVGRRQRGGSEGSYERVTFWCPTCQPDPS